jgi:putative transposase
MKNTYHPESQKNSSGFIPTLSECGQTEDSSRTSGHQGVTEDTTSPTSSQTCSQTQDNPSSSEKKKRSRKTKSATVGSPRRTKKTTSKDKSNTCTQNTQLTGSSQTSDQASTSSAQVSGLSWISRAKDVSTKLWLPTETDCAGLPSNCFTGSLKCIPSNSWFSMKAWYPKEATQNSLKTCWQSSMYTPVESMVKESTVVKNKKPPKKKQTKPNKSKKPKKPPANRCRKIRVYPNREQRITLNKWFGCVRKTYNWALENIKEDDSIPKTNMMQLRRYFVNEEFIPDDMKYLLECPKHIRDGALEDLTQAYKTNFAKLENNPNHRFDIKFRSKKKNQSILIQSENQLYDGREKTWQCFKTFLKNKLTFRTRTRDVEKGKTIESINYACRLTKDRLGRFYLCIPFRAPKCDNQALDARKWVAIDPGVRTFITTYSPAFGESYKVGDRDANRFFRLCLWLDKMYSKKSRTFVHSKKRKITKAINRQHLRIKHLVDEVHWKAIDFLTKKYTDIIIPPFESSNMVKKGNRKINKKCVRQMLSWRHYTFRQRLMTKALEKGINVYVMGEEYTTKTCTCCFNINNKVGGAKVFNCPHCHISVDRDIAGARNIFLKNSTVS